MTLSHPFTVDQQAGPSRPSTRARLRRRWRWLATLAVLVGAVVWWQARPTFEDRMNPMVARAQAELHVIATSSGVGAPVETVPGHPPAAGGFVDSNPPHAARSGRATVRIPSQGLDALDDALRKRGYRPHAAACATLPSDGGLPTFVVDDQVLYRLDRSDSARPPEIQLNVEVRNDEAGHPMEATLDVLVDPATFEFVDLPDPTPHTCK